MAYMTNIFAMNLPSSNTIMDELNKIAISNIRMVQNANGGTHLN
jgi:hypothetical protein